MTKSARNALPASGTGDGKIHVQRVTGNSGALIQGIDLGKGWDDKAFAVIHNALVEYGVVFLRGQSWNVDQQLEFAKLLGKPAYSKKLPFYMGAYAYVSVLENDGTEYPIGALWHTDNTDWECPPMGAVLHCEEVPEYGGDTIWASTYAAYNLLSEPIKRMLDGMTALHDNSIVAELYRGSRGVRNSGLEVNPPVEHPIIRTHPVTKRKALFVNAGYTRKITGLDSAQSKALLEMLFAQMMRPEVQVRFRWEPNSVAIWDNRCTQHYAVGDYAGQRRKMRRVQIEGDRPY